MDRDRPAEVRAAGNAGNRAEHRYRYDARTLILRANIAASAQVSLREYTAMSGPTGGPFGLVFPVSFVSGLATHFAARNFAE